MKRKHLLAAFAAILAVAFFDSAAYSQRWDGAMERMRARAAEVIGKPFVGVTTNGKQIPDLFPIRASGVSTEPVHKAAEAFLDGLSKAQRDKTAFPVDDDEWQLWANQHFYVRQGVGFDEMDNSQRELAFGLLKASFSDKGLKRSQDVMKLNYSLGELANNFEELNEWLYWITIMGEPSATEPWGWQIDGHHLIINYFVLGDQVVMSPVFLGSEPPIATTGKFKGLAVMQDEQEAGLQMINSLNDAQLKQAVIETGKTGNNILSEAFKDHIVLDYAGIRGDALTSNQQKLLLAVVEEYVGNMDQGHARVKMDEVKAHIDETYFAWIGGHEADSVFYYRVQSPVLLIEFDHINPTFLPGPRVPTRQHVHSMLRTPNGNDYGKDLLRQHYARSHR